MSDTLLTPSEFDKIVLTYQGRLLGFACSLISDRQIAEDLVQETFLALWEANTSGQLVEAIYPWLCRVLLNLRIQHFRRAGAKKRGRPQSLNTVQAGGAEITIDPVEQGPTPGEIVERRDCNDWVRKALEALSEDNGTAILLFHYECKSYQEASHILNIPEATFKSRLGAARKRLREMILRDGLNE